MQAQYTIKRLTSPITLDGNWNKAAWQDHPALHISYYMGSRPSHMPDTQARLGYDDDAIYVIFRVKDQYVRAVATNYHDAVCEDSCVEFFFTPGGEISEGYFNLEMNCGGTILFKHQTARDQNTVAVSEEHCKEIQIYHSLPKIVEPEITTPTTWTVEYRLPVDILAAYAPVARPAKGVLWWANLYKCGDKTSHPHWLSWAPIDKPQPDFHRPDFFAMLTFE